MPGNDENETIWLSKRATGATVNRSVRTMRGMAERARRKTARLSGSRFTLLWLALAFAASPAHAEAIRNEIAVFAALDKVTGRINHLEIPMNQTVEFGALKVTPRVCDTRPPTEPPRTTSFVEVDETTLTGEVHRIFTGWMFAESPGLHAVEHPVFDVWLTSCKTPIGGTPSESAANAPPGEVPEAAEVEPEPAPAPAPPPADAAPAPPPAAEVEPDDGVLPWLVPNDSSRRR